MVSSVEHAYQEIRNRLLDGRLQPGEPLREEKLAGFIGVSRTPVREALRRLEQEGLIEYISNQGFTASIWELDELKHLLEIRAHIEGYLARITVERISPEQLETLSIRAQEMVAEINREEPDLELIAQLNASFHALMLEASSFTRISSIASSVRDLSFVHRPDVMRNVVELKRSLMQHLDIVSAIYAGDGELVEAITKAHILGSWQSVKRAYENLHPGS